MISTFKRSSWTPNGYETTEYSSEYTITFTTEEAFEILRAERDYLLKKSDWMANSDVTMSEEWRVYRQALRDLPNTQTPSLDENGQLTNITWPEKPQ